MTDTAEVLAALAKIDQRLGREHAENQDATAEFKREVTENLAELRRAFPGSDPDGHRRYHEQVIELAAARTKFWREITSKLMQQGIWAVIVAVGMAAGYAAVAWIRSVK